MYAFQRVTLKPDGELDGMHEWTEHEFTLLQLYSQGTAGMYDIFLVVAIAFWREEEEDDLKLSSVHNQPSQNLLPKMFRFAAPKIVSFFLSTTYVPYHFIFSLFSF